MTKPDNKALGVQERVLWFCLGSGTDWKEAGVTLNTVAGLVGVSTMPMPLVAPLSGRLALTDAGRTSGSCCGTYKAGARRRAARPGIGQHPPTASSRTIARKGLPGFRATPARGAGCARLRDLRLVALARECRETRCRSVEPEPRPSGRGCQAEDARNSCEQREIGAAARTSAAAEP